MKTLSIIIPIYNTPKEYFSKCLTSLICGQSDEIEVIIVDDGSLEEYSIEIEKEIKDSPLDIKYYKKRNGGQNSAREYGFLMSIGKYIFFMDSDDYVDTVVLDDIILLLKNNEPDILAFNYDVRTTDDIILQKYERWHGKYNKIDINKGLLYRDSLCLQIYNKNALLKSGIHLIQDVRIGEDMASATAILATIGEEYTTEKCLYHYVKHTGSTLSNPPIDSALDIIRAFDSMLGQLNIETKVKYHNELEWLAILHVLYYNTERILKSFDGNRKFIKKIRNWLKLSYPNWRNNPYLKIEPITRSASFILIKFGCPMLLQSLRKIKTFLK